MNLMTTVVCVVAFGLTACNSGEQKVTFDKELRHDNGLMVSRPGGFDDKMTETGFVFSEIGGRRTPRIITVTKADSRPAPTNAEERALGHQIARYTITDLGTASGGTEYELIASKASGHGYIVLSEISQLEGDAPEFTIGWAVLENARLR